MEPIFTFPCIWFLAFDSLARLAASCRRLPLESHSEVNLRVGLSVVYPGVGIVSVQILAIVSEEIQQVSAEAITHGYSTEVVEHKSAVTIVHRVVVVSVIVTPEQSLCLCLVWRTVVLTRVIQMVPNGNHRYYRHV